MSRSLAAHQLSVWLADQGVAGVALGDSGCSIELVRLLNGMHVLPILCQPCAIV